MKRKFKNLRLIHKRMIAGLYETDKERLLIDLYSLRIGPIYKTNLLNVAAAFYWEGRPTFRHQLMEKSIREAFDSLLMKGVIMYYCACTPIELIEKLPKNEES